MPTKKEIPKEVEAKRIDFAGLNIEDLKEECAKRKISYTGLQTRTKMIDAILAKESEPEAKVELKPSQREIDKASVLTDYDKKQISKTPQHGKFQIVVLKGGRTVMINKQNQVVSPVTVEKDKQSDLVRTLRDMNMKDPEQKPFNKLLPDTPTFGGGVSTPPHGTITEETSGQVANPKEVARAENHI